MLADAQHTLHVQIDGAVRTFQELLFFLYSSDKRGKRKAYFFQELVNLCYKRKLEGRENEEIFFRNCQITVRDKERSFDGNNVFLLQS